MKKILVAIVVTLLGASAAFAASITTSKHNLSSLGGQSIRSNNTAQVCVFCHTPHSAIVNVPLWNRTSPTASGFKLYTSSGTLTAATKAATLTSTSISLMCLSCHDGVAGMIASRVNNQPSSGTITMGSVVWTNGNLGTDLTNDHPIGFNYVTAQGDDAGLKDKATAETAGAKFFGSTNQMECASCHLVHDNAIAPFLRVTNTGSALCLACHTK